MKGGNLDQFNIYIFISMDIIFIVLTYREYKNIQAKKRVEWAPNEDEIMNIVMVTSALIFMTFLIVYLS
jgi:hypothetical protein